jgi:hypothetical protein
MDTRPIVSGLHPIEPREHLLALWQAIEADGDDVHGTLAYLVRGLTPEARQHLRTLLADCAEDDADATDPWADHRDP